MIVFDMNETTLDLAPVRDEVDTIAASAGGFTVWFQKLLQLSTTVTATNMEFVGFGTLARQALDTVLLSVGSTASDEEWARVASAFGRLQPYPDVRAGLQQLRAAGNPTMALTNSEQASAESQCDNAGLTGLFDHIVSAGFVTAYKPAAAPYEHAARLAGLDAADMWMVACHDWDLAGARSVGFRTAFVRRPGMAYATTYPAPDISASDFEDLADKLA